MSAPSTSRASAKWRKKKLDENAKEFRAKEALRIKNYRAQMKEKRKHSLRTRLEEDSRVVQDEDELSDDVDAWLYNATEGHSGTSHSKRSSRFSSTRRTPRPPPSLSSSSSIEDPHSDDEAPVTPRPSKTITLQEAHEFIANGQKTLQEWTTRWGSGAHFWHRAADALLGTCSVMDPADRARTRRDILDMIRKAREAISQLESIAFIDVRSIQNDKFGGFWLEIIRVFEGLYERIAQANAVLRLQSLGNLSTCT